MKRPELIKGIPLADFRISEAGFDMLESNPELLPVIEDFAKAPERPENNLEEYESIGGGKNAAVRNVGGCAVKVSSPTTNNLEGAGAENLIDQYVFLRALGKNLSARTSGTMTTPEQYVALQSENGNFMLVQELKLGWHSLARAVGVFDDRRSTVNAIRQVGQRIDIAMRRSPLRPGVSDLFQARTLNTGNILVPKDRVLDEETPLCIIDQPGRGLKGRIGVAAAKLLL